MKKWKRAALLYGLLMKRFLKNKVFLLLLFAVPLLLLCLKNISGEDSGVMNIVLCAEDPDDMTAQAVIDRICHTDGLVRYTVAEDEETARQTVLSKGADAAWIFRKDFQSKIDGLTSGTAAAEAPVAVLERHGTVLLRLSNIQLFFFLYPELSFSLYRDFAENYLDLEVISQDELAAAYEEAPSSGSGFRHSYEETTRQEDSYLLAPFRGLLALLILLGGLAADMFFLQDEARGMLDRTALCKRRKILLLYQAAAMTPIALMVMTALSCAGMLGQPLTELVFLVFYLADCMAFCALVERLCGNAQRLGACIPVLMLGMFVLCPVFFTVRRLRPVQYLFPPYYYLSAVNTGGQAGYLAMMAIYAAAGFAVQKLTEPGNLRRRLRAGLEGEKNVSD